jgi:uncharacterized repeat protein (TIGR04138 family)
MEAIDFDKAVEQVMQRDGRYHRDAYLFVRDALDHTQKNIVRVTKEGIRHVSARELLEGIRVYGLHVYGPMTMLVLNDWGIHGCEDFGEIVFNLIESGLFAKTDQDNRDDFKTGFAFDEAFKKPFLPNSRPGLETQQASIPDSARKSESVDPA